MEEHDCQRCSVGVIVAHPDDEILWVGGTLLLHPTWHCHIVTLCRAGDADRAPKCARVLSELGATGQMADLDDGPEQAPLAQDLVEETVLALLGDRRFDLLYTHGPAGEYTWHLRHVEVSRAVTSLWTRGRLSSPALRLFAYDDAGRTTLPRALPDASVQVPLPREIWQQKYRFIHEMYGFTADSWEARATPGTEAFWHFTDPDALAHWLKRERIRRESSGIV